MSRSLTLSEHARWWPSTLFQTSTLELRRGRERLLVDLGVSPWEMREVMAARPEPVTQLLLTHADWDHVLGAAVVPAQATVSASAAAAERVTSGSARKDVERFGGQLYLALPPLERLRVDRLLEPPLETQLGAWPARVLPTPGHSSDGVAAWLPEERLLCVGDYLSTLEIPFVNSSAPDYRDTLQALLELIERERPLHVASGHGPPLPAEEALAVGREDLDYVERLLAGVAGGAAAEELERDLAYPSRTGDEWDAFAHRSNVERACAARPA